MKNLGQGQKIGLFTELVSGVIMAILVLVGKPVPDIVAWLFMAGLVTVLVSSLYLLRKK